MGITVSLHKFYCSTMKNIFLLLLLFILIGCKNDQKKELPIDDELNDQEHVIDSIHGSENDLDLRQRQTLNLKRRELIDKVDQKVELENLVISKSFFKQGDWYVMDFKYPYLNESVKPSYENFNEYI